MDRRLANYAPVISAALAVTTMTATARAVEYTFTSIFDVASSEYVVPPIIPYGTLYENGEYAFLGSTSVASGIYTGPNPTSDVYVDTSGEFASFGLYPGGTSYKPEAIDSTDNHTVFYAALDGGGAGLFYGPDSNSQAIAKTTAAGGSFESITDFAVSGNGHYAFVVETTVSANTKRTDIYGGSSLTDAPTLLVSQSSYDRFEKVGISNDGTLVYEAHSVESPGQLERQNFILKDNLGTTVMVTGSKSDFDGIVMTDEGDILYGYQGKQYLTDSTLLTTEIDAPTYGYGDIHLNSLGEIATFGTPSGIDSVFVGSEAIIKEGDIMFGGTIDHLYSIGGFNDLGQVLFTYRVDLDGGPNNVYGLGLATPTVPEPASLLLLSLGGLTLLGGRRLRSDR